MMTVTRLVAAAMVFTVLLWGTACASQPAAPAAPTAAPKTEAAPAAKPAGEAPKTAATEAPKPAATAAPAAPKVTFPEKPVTLIVPSPAGGSVDREARTAAEAIKPFFSQPVAVVNRPGGGAGSVGTAEMTQAKGDGYTLALVLSAGLTVQPLLTNLPYKTSADYAPVNNYINLIFLFVVNNDSPWKTMKDAIDYSKANPGKIRVGTPGVGSLSHFAVEMLKEKAGVDMTHVPQSGDAESVTAVLGGHLEGMVAAPGSVASQIQAGKLRALASFTAQRDSMYPNVPSMKELGYDISLVAYHPLIAPKGTPDPVIQILDSAFKKAMETDAFKKYAADTSLTLSYMGPADLKKRIDADLALSADLIKKLGISTK